MRKRLFQPFIVTLLLLAALSIFTVSPASAASTTQKHLAKASTSATLARPAAPYICDFLVTANINIRSGPGTNYPRVGGIYSGTTVRASLSEQYGTGYYWRFVYYGPTGWSAANWMQFQGNCSYKP